MPLAARNHIERVLFFDYHLPVPAPLARARARILHRRARTHAAAGHVRVLGAVLAPVHSPRSCRPFFRALPLHLCANRLCERSAVPDLSAPTLLALFLYLYTRFDPPCFSPDVHYTPPISNMRRLASPSTACPS
jgi:hypothetical protein